MNDWTKKTLTLARLLPQWIEMITKPLPGQHVTVLYIGPQIGVPGPTGLLPAPRADNDV